MFFNISLCSLVIFLVSANSIVPVQTYPIYQQNGYTNPSASQPQNIQTYFQGDRVENEINVSPSSIREALLNKLLPNPTGHTTLDHSIMNYCSYLNGIENNEIPINFVNNYPIGSTFYLTNDTTNVKNENNSIGNKIRKSSKRRIRKSKRKQKDNDEENTKKEKDFSINIENPQSLRKEEKEIITNNNKKSRRKNKHTILLENNVTENQNQLENNRKPKRRVKKQKNTTVKSELENEISIVPTSTGITDDLDLVFINEGKGTEHRQTKNSNPKPNESLTSIPLTAEEITKQYLKNLYQYSDPEMTNWFNDYKNFYESLLVNKPITKISKRKHKRKKKSGKGKRKYQKKNVSTKNIIEATTIMNTNEVILDSTTTESITYWSEQIESNLNFDQLEETFRSLQENEKDLNYSSNEIFKNGYTINEYEELSENGFYGGYIDDYYPQFFDNAAYNANNKEIILKSLNNNKYYYATDKIDTDFINKYDDQTNQWTENSEIKHTYDEFGRKYKADNDNIEELKFRSPPFLESPDFITRQLDKSEVGLDGYYNSYNDVSDRFVGDKSSTYSGAKSSNIFGSKRNEISEPKKNIETSYAKSKVASYGAVYIPVDNLPFNKNDRSKIEHSNAHSFESNNYQNDGTTYVIAESLDNPDLYL